MAATFKSGSSATTRRSGRPSGLEWLPFHDSNDHRESPDSAEPRLTKDPLDRSEPNDPIEPMDNADPTLPMDRIEYADPMERMDPSDRIDRIDRDERRLRRLLLRALSTVAIAPVYHNAAPPGNSHRPAEPDVSEPETSFPQPTVKKPRVGAKEQLRVSVSVA